jgi:lysophospholipase L1-like esterase
MKHVILLGDSIFDNAAYVRAGSDVLTHLRNQMPPGWRATLKAVDGSVVQSVNRQIQDIPQDATHIVISVGGNDALHNAGLLEMRVQSTAQVFGRLAEIVEEFQHQYHKMLKAVSGLGLPTAICTIYFPRFPDPTIQKLTVTALSAFNDVIIREAIMARLPLLDLRLICNRDEDYANPIEPSEEGGSKIAAAVLNLVREHKFENRRTEVFL